GNRPPGEHGNDDERGERVSPAPLEAVDQRLEPAVAHEKAGYPRVRGAQLRAIRQPEAARPARDRRVRCHGADRDLYLDAVAENVQAIADHSHADGGPHRAAAVVVERVEFSHSAMSKSKSSAISCPAAPTWTLSACVIVSIGSAASAANLSAL